MILEDPLAVVPELIENVQNPVLTKRWQYFNGTPPKAWVNTKMREIFRGLADSMNEPYCGLAVNARVNRMNVKGFGTPQALELWNSGRFPQRQDTLYRWGLVHGAVYLLNGEDEEGQKQIAANPATLMYGAADPNNWARLAWSGKLWRDGEVWRVSVYDDEKVSSWSVEWVEDKPVDVENLAVEDQSSHGFDELPVTSIHPYGPNAPVLIDQIAPIQDRINKLGSNKFVAAEFGAFKQRVFFTRQAVDPFDLKNAPDEAIILDPGEGDGQARVQELEATDLANYDAAKNAEVDALFTIATLPRHMRVNPGTTVSGEAIKADEGPFVEAVHDHQREFGAGITRAMALFGIEDEPIWKDPEVRNELTVSEVVRTLVDAGLPWQIALRKYGGMSEDEITEAEELVAATRAETEAAYGESLRGAVTS